MPAKTLNGKVKKIIDRCTLTVDVVYPVRHPLYLKVLKKCKKYTCHYENSEVKVDDLVVIAECKPFSKTKTWRLLNIVE